MAPSTTVRVSGAVVLAARMIMQSAPSSAECPSDPSIPGFGTLQELHEAMQTDFSLVRDGVAVPPFQYLLCPGVKYFPAKEGRWIEPVADGTEILCGLEGRSEDMCVVEGADLHVAFIASEYPEYPRRHTKLQGITFTGSTGWSVAAYDSKETTAEFVDCHWKNITGQTAIQIVEKDRPIMSSNQTVARSQTATEELTYLPGMTVKLKGCSFENVWGGEDDFFFVVSNADGILMMENVQFKNNMRKTNGTAVAIWNEGLAEINSCDFHNNEFDVSIYNFGGSAEIKESSFRENTGQSSISATRGYTDISGNKFLSNRHPESGSIEVLEGYVDISVNEFWGTLAEAEIIVYGEKAEVYMEHLCFLSGDYSFTLVFVGGNALLGEVSNVYADGLQIRNNQQCINTPGVFVQGGLFDHNYTACFDRNPATPCKGSCNEVFTSRACSSGAQLTPPPTPPSTSQPKATPKSDARELVLSKVLSHVVPFLIGWFMS